MPKTQVFKVTLNSLYYMSYSPTCFGSSELSSGAKKSMRENTHETKLYNKTKCITRYLNIQKVPSLLIVNTYIPFQMYCILFNSILTLNNFYNYFFAHRVNTWDPVMYSAHCQYLSLMNVGLRMVQEGTETCSHTGMPMVVQVVF